MVWLVSLSMEFSRIIHVIACINAPLILGLNNILLYANTTSCLSTDQLHVPVLFPLFGYYEQATINTHVWIFMWIYVFIYIGYMPMSGIAGSMVTLWLGFQGTAQLFSKQLRHFT